MEGGRMQHPAGKSLNLNRRSQAQAPVVLQADTDFQAARCWEGVLLVGRGPKERGNVSALSWRAQCLRSRSGQVRDGTWPCPPLALS